MSKWAKWYQGIYAKSFNKRNDRSGHLWQDRYFAKQVGPGQHLAKTWMYVEQNPVKANIVQKAEDWKWSSAYLRLNFFRPQYLMEPEWWLTSKKKDWWSENLLDEETLGKVRISLERKTTESLELEWEE